ncbi:hydrogen peroxide-inducible genes activator [Vibrio variabilis]|uniref:Hydrogen peroxide-inducible genes activator n=1 Tax=Vibrio variabilis TaxID=990271 RepID=A0ABQ0J505_9VIBR|nr:hydrogen peroxide-inducible genes activator [Vibrio variabilis]
MVANGLGTTFIPQMAIEHGLLENQNLIVIELLVSKRTEILDSYGVQALQDETLSYS